MNGPHVRNHAEAYVLGWLSDDERRAVDAHAAGCAECLQSLGEAERTVTSLAAALPRSLPSAQLARRLSGADAPAAGRRAPSPLLHATRWFAPLAAAAALVLVLGGTLAVNQNLRGELADNELALVQVVNSHFNHVSMNAVAGAGSAKVLYARDGGWIYVVADNPPAGAHVFASVAGAERDLGALEREGDVATLFVRGANRPSSVTLRDGERVVATARLQY